MLRGLPHALVHLGLDVPMELKHRICDAFSNLNECDLSDLFMALIRKMWPSFADMQSDECIAFLQAWPARELLVTKVVEYAHRSNKSVSRPTGPGKPSNVRTMANASYLNRIGVLHSEVVSQGSRLSMSARPWVGLV